MVSAVCHIVGAGEFFGNIEPKSGDIVIAADGGYDYLKSIGITPDIIIGDMDSVKEVPEGIKRIVFPARKDETDMYLAYQKGVELGYKKFIIYGGTGGREDHTFANYCLLISAKKVGHDIILMSYGCKIYALVDEEKEIQGRCGAIVSVFAFGKDAEGVSIKHLSYEADNITLAADNPIGVSNEYSSSERGVISVKNGALLVMEQI